jgi:hypothetical protein
VNAIAITRDDGLLKTALYRKAQKSSSPCHPRDNIVDIWHDQRPTEHDLENNVSDQALRKFGRLD